MSRFARGEAAAFELLYRRHESRVWRYLIRHVGNHAIAEELTQEVWFAVARDAARYKPSARFTTWVFTLAHNRMVDSFRARRPTQSLNAPDNESGTTLRQLAASSGAEPFAAAVANDQLAALLNALHQLPPEQREAFVLQVEGDCSIDDIAAITGTSFETAKSRLRYARTKLRELLKEHL